MKKQATLNAKISLVKTTIARLNDFFAKDNEKDFTDSDTVTSAACKGMTLFKW